MTIPRETTALSAAIFVLGCKVNQAEAAGMKRILADAGFRLCGPTDFPDLIIVNTCCVTSKAEGKSRRLVNRLRRMHPDSLILVTGCLAETRPSSFDITDGRLLVYRQSDRANLKKVLGQNDLSSLPMGGKPDVRKFVDFGVSLYPTKAREFIKIQDGCSSNCSYCIVPRARGPARSLDAETVRDHVEKMADNEVAEIVLTGVNLGVYGQDLTPPVNIEWLLRALLKDQSRVRLRLSSLEPEHISSGIVELMAGHDRLCNHLHIPLQSGDDRILQHMNRPYNASLIRSLIDRVLSKIPHACIGFDVIVGFPGETDEAFNRTLELVQDCQASYLHVFPFSSRPDTLAAKFPDRVPDPVLRERVQVLRDLSVQFRRQFFERCIGGEYSVVVESGPDPLTNDLLVRTDNYIPAYCPAAKQLLTEKRGTVKLVDLRNGRVIGQAS